MPITITLGWWVAPLAFMAVGYVWALPCRQDERGGHYGDIACAICSLARAGVITIAGLMGWLAWALLA